MNSITFHRLGPDDFDRLMAVPEGLFDNPMRLDQARAFLDDPGCAGVLAYDGPLAVGMATGQVLLHPDKAPSFFINEVGVRDSHLRRGIGRAVTERLMAEARAMGCDGIWLGTEVDNLLAQALYRSMNGEEVAGFFYGWDDAL